LILQNDVAEFIPYTIQLIGFMLQIHQTVPDLYAKMLTPFLQPPLWEIQGNVPALAQLIKVYITKDMAGILARNQTEAVLGVFQKLIASKLNDQYGCEILITLVDHMPADRLSAYIVPIVHLLLNRLQNSRTEKFMVEFTHLVFYFMNQDNHPVLGLNNTVSLFERIQAGLFANLAQSILAPAVTQVYQPSHYKICAVGLTRLLTESPMMLQPPNNGSWPALFKALVQLLNSKGAAAPSAPAIDHDEMEMEESIGFQATFNRLGSITPIKKDVLPNIPDVRVFFSTQFKAFNAAHPDVLAGAVQVLDDAQKTLVATLLNS
jgi:exportin-2 (importin alpha re-exporter)